MLTRKFRSSLRQLTAGLLLVCGVSAATHAATVNVSASPTSVTVGNSVSVFFDISGLGADLLAGFSFIVNYDSSVLGFTGFTFVDPGTSQNQLDFDLTDPDSIGFFGYVNPIVAGTLDVLALSGDTDTFLSANQANSFRLLTLTFDALGAASSAAISMDPGSSLFVGDLASSLSVDFQSARALVEITSNGGGIVPEPGALSLLLAALFGAGAAMRRRSVRVAAGIAASLVLSGTALAQAQQGTVVAKPIEAVVVEVQGMRLKVRTTDGREFWVTVKTKVGTEKVGSKLTGQASTMGDSILVSNPVFTRVP